MSIARFFLGDLFIRQVLVEGGTRKPVLLYTMLMCVCRFH